MKEKLQCLGEKRRWHGETRKNRMEKEGEKSALDKVQWLELKD